MSLLQTFIAGVITVLIVVISPFVLAYFDLIPSLNSAAGYILLITAGGLVLKSLLADIAANEFQWSKFGYDYCTIGFGGILAALSLQLISKEDLFPGIGKIVWLKDIPLIAGSVSITRSAQFFVALIIALIFTIFAARISALIKQTNSPTLSLINAVLGGVLLGAYALVLISKG